MKSTRKLSLKRERLTELSNDQLDGLAGGLAAETAIYIAVITRYCATNNPCNTVDNKCATDYRTLCCRVAAVEVAG